MPFSPIALLRNPVYLAVIGQKIEKQGDISILPRLFSPD